MYFILYFYLFIYWILVLFLTSKPFSTISSTTTIIIIIILIIIVINSRSSMCFYFMFGLLHYFMDRYKNLCILSLIYFYLFYVRCTWEKSNRCHGHMVEKKLFFHLSFTVPIFFLSLLNRKGNIIFSLLLG